MTVNARMQPFDNEEFLEIFSSNDIPLDEFGTGMEGDGETKSNLFIIIPDDDDPFNFVPGIGVYAAFSGAVPAGEIPWWKTADGCGILAR